MRIVRALLTRHPASAYFALTFLVSWGGALLVIGGSGGMLGTTPASDPRFARAVVAMLAGPSVAGLLLTTLVHGRAGLRELWSRLLAWRTDVRWYAVALLTAPVLMAATLFVLSSTDPAFVPGILTSDRKASLLLLSLAVGLSAGVFEELGWTGFAIPTLKRGHGVLATGLMVGIWWSAWHLLPNGWASRAAAGELEIPVYAATTVLGVFIGYLTAFRILMVWVYDHTKSLFIGMLMHASFTTSLLVLNPLNLSGARLATYSFILAAAVWLVVLVGVTPARAALAATIRRHPVLAYYTLVFAISWGGILLVIGGPGGIPGAPEDVERLFPFALVALFAGPSVAGILMTAIVSGKAGLRALVSRLLLWRVSGRWYAAALLPGPVLVATILFALSLGSPEFLPGIITSDNKIGLLIFGLAWGLVGGGLLEELGWTGFAVPTLRQRFGALSTGLIVGLLWGAWHVLIAFWASRGLAGESSLATFVAGFLVFYVVALPAYRVLMVWVYDGSASLLVAMLMHAILSASTMVLQPQAASAHLTWNIVLALALWAIVAAVAAAGRRPLERPSFRRRTA
jgi:membrane protease YdiL (CAAX protease family)